MQTSISLLRGINVSGQKQVRMAELKSLYEDLGFENVRTYVQSGNVVFDSPEREAGKLTVQIEKLIEKTFGFFVPVLIRSAEDFRRILENHPFKHEEPLRVLVTFLSETPEQSKLDALSCHEDKVDKFAIGEKEIFLFCPGGYGKTKLSNTFFEKKLGVAATTRNWKTVKALYEMAQK
jgi:uncharacterized protein (DUF1697 family)